nr:hypothetical protein [Neisseria benedictiae]
MWAQTLFGFKGRLPGRKIELFPVYTAVFQISQINYRNWNNLMIKGLPRII